MNGLERVGKKESLWTLIGTLLKGAMQGIVGFLSLYSALFAVILPLVAVYKLFMADYIAAACFLIFSLVFMFINSKIVNL